MCEDYQINFVFPAVNRTCLITVIKILDKLRKRCHKFTHMLQLSQSCEQEDLNSSNKFLHLIGPITEQR